jgi:hypothetical protein
MVQYSDTSPFSNPCLQILELTEKAFARDKLSTFTSPRTHSQLLGLA